MAKSDKNVRKIWKLLLFFSALNVIVTLVDQVSNMTRVIVFGKNACFNMFFASQNLPENRHNNQRGRKPASKNYINLHFEMELVKWEKHYFCNVIGACQISRILCPRGAYFTARLRYAPLKSLQDLWAILWTSIFYFFLARPIVMYWPQIIGGEIPYTYWHIAQKILQISIFMGRSAVGS